MKAPPQTTRGLGNVMQWFGVCALLYVSVAWMTFQHRNPKANNMSLCRDFMQVMTWQVMKVYQ